MINFSSDPPVPVHDIRGEYNLPERYTEDNDSIHYSMVGPMIDSVNDDVDIQIPVSEYPDDALIYLYRSIVKTNNDIARNDGKLRWDGMSSRLLKELENRGIDIPDTELTQEVTMTKAQAIDVPLNEVPVIIKIGEVPEDDYEFGTSYENMVWEVLTTKNESKYLEQEFEDINVENV